MKTSHLAELKLSIMKLDEQILEILLPHHSLSEEELLRVASLEQARTSAHRLMEAGVGLSL